MHSYALSEEEIEKTAAALSKLEAGYLPLPIFLQTTRLMAVMAVELVVVRRNPDTKAGGDIEVLLTQREADDALWPNMWHNPGSVIRPTDDMPDYAQALQRIYVSELGIAASRLNTLQPVYVDTLFHRTRRGKEVGRVYWLEFADQPAQGRFFAADKLPDDMIESHVDVVNLAVTAYNQTLLPG